MSSSISSFFSSFLPVVYADSEEKPEKEPESTESQEEEEAKLVEEAVEAEEEEAEDPHPIMREECKATKCAQLAQHFDHCQEKVSSGRGFKGEDCVEELMMHCVDDCTAPKLFTKLR